MGYIVEQHARGEANIAFRGERNSIWHRLGNQMRSGMSVQEWAEAAGTDFEAVMVPAYMLINGEMREVPGVKHCARKDNNYHLGVATNVYKLVQPIETLQVLEPYCTSDSRFELDVAGHLSGGKRVWATAVFNDDFTVAGDKFKARLLASTSYDGKAATVIKATTTRAVCDNTLDMALLSKGGEIRVRHATKFDHEFVGRQLAEIIQNMEQFKRMGDAMAQHHMRTDETQAFLRRLLDIPTEDLSEVNTRKVNTLNDLQHAYDATVREGTEPGTAWCALNAVTRYVDHTRGTRSTGQGETENRFFSAQFSSGAAMKAKAVDMLYKMDDGALLKACVAATEAKASVSRLLSQPLMVR